MSRLSWVRRARSRCSPALVVACIALLVALGGTSYATVIAIPASSVGTAQLKPQAVTAAKLAPNAVRTANVANGTLLTEDFKRGQLPASGLATLKFASVPEQVNVPSTTPVRVASLDVPAGPYLVTAALNVFSDGLFCKSRPTARPRAATGATAASSCSTGSSSPLRRASKSGASAARLRPTARFSEARPRRCR